MITVYHSPFTRSVRVRWLLEELGVPYQLETISFAYKARMSPEYLRVHPLGQLPALDDGPVHLFESGAIVQYLLERYDHGALAPAPGDPERAAFLQWSWFGEASLTREIGELMRHRLLLPEDKRIPQVIEPARKDLARKLQVLETALDGRDFILLRGFSAADIMLDYPLMLAERTQELPEQFPRVRAYHARLSERPGYQKALS